MPTGPGSVPQEIISAPSDLRLAPFVKCLWSFRSALPAALPGIVAPDAHVEFVVHLDRPWSMGSNDDELSIQPQAFLLPQSRGSLRFAADGPSDLVAFRTNAAGATALIGPRLSEMWDESIPLEEVWGDRARALVDALAGVHAPEARFAVLERFLARQLSEVDGETTRTVALLEETMRQAPRASVRALAEGFGTGMRTLERRFSRSVGLTPQRVHLIARLLHGCHLLRTAPELDVSAIAQEAGFYDHAYFANRFRQLVGASPSHFRALEDVHYVLLS